MQRSEKASGCNGQISRFRQRFNNLELIEGKVARKPRILECQQCASRGYVEWLHMADFERDCAVNYLGL